MFVSAIDPLRDRTEPLSVQHQLHRWRTEFHELEQALARGEIDGARLTLRQLALEVPGESTANPLAHGLKRVEEALRVSDVEGARHAFADLMVRAFTRDLRGEGGTTRIRGHTA